MNKRMSKNTKEIRSRSHRHNGGTVVLLLLAALAVSAAGLRYGSADMPWKDFFSALLCKKGYETFTLILFRVRLPRVAAGAVAGVGLSVSGVLLQNVTANDLAGPNIIGVNAGAGFAMIVLLSFFPSAYAWGPAAAFLGAFLTTLIITAAGSRAGGTRSSVILAGIAVTAMLNAGISFLSLLDSDVLASYNYFSVGGLAGVAMNRLPLPTAICAFSLLAVLLMSRKIDVLALGDSLAGALGERVRVIRTLCLLLASASAAAAVSFAGLLGFVGLVVPHMARRLVGYRTGILTLASAVLGIITVNLADLLGRCLFAPTEIPVGIMMAVVGAPFFFALLMGKRGRL